MTIEVMVNVLKFSAAEPRAKLVLMGIANHHGELGAWPSISTLAAYANCSERSVKRDIQYLVDIGELIVEKNAAPIRGQYRPNLYFVTIGDDGSGVTDLAPGVTDSTSGVTGQVIRGDSIGTQNIIKPKETLKNISPSELKGEFDLFWNAYPRKVEKVDAHRAFVKAVSEFGALAILAGANRLANDPNLPAKQFIPYPASWLRAGGWTNEPYPPRIETPEERRDRMAQLNANRHEVQNEETRVMMDIYQKALDEAKANPPARCEHDRVAVMCRVCGVKKSDVGDTINKTDQE